MPSAPSVAETMSRSSSPPGYLRVACSSPLDALSATGIPSSLPSMRESALQKVVPFQQPCPRGADSWLDGPPSFPDFIHELGERRFQLRDDVVDTDVLPVHAFFGEFGECGHDDRSPHRGDEL